MEIDIRKGMTGQATVVSDGNEPASKRRKSVMTSAQPANRESVMQEGEYQEASQKTRAHHETRMGEIRVVKSGFQ
jgi:hypothetical protein